MCCSRTSDSCRPRPRDGFSLVEVLVAFVLASIMAMTFLAAQRGAFDMAERVRTTWTQLNAVQAFLIERPPANLVEPREAWIAMPGDFGVEWSLEVTPDIMGIDRAMLERPGEKDEADEQDGGTAGRRTLKPLEPPVLDLIHLKTRLDGALTEWNWYGGGRDAAP